MNTSRIGHKLEKILADDIDGQFTPGSGCLPFAKGDITSDRFLIECKASERGIIRITLKWVYTIMQYAADRSKTWGLAMSPDVRYTDNYLIILPAGVVEDPELNMPLPSNRSKGFTINTATMEAIIPRKIGDTGWVLTTREDFRMAL